MHQATPAIMLYIIISSTHIIDKEYKNQKYIIYNAEWNILWSIW